MKLHLLHGPGKTGSRKKLIEIKEKFDPTNIVVFEEGSKVADIADNLVATSLFTDERLVVLENPDDIDFLPTTRFATFVDAGARRATYSLPTILLLWFDHELSDKSSTLKWVKENKGEILFFPESKEVSVFPFLNYLGNRDKRAFLEMDNLKKAGYDNQYLITMILYLLRTLSATPKNAAPFLKQKLEKQRKNFSSEELTNLYKFVLETDFKIKSGLLEKDQAEFLLVNKFIS